MGEILLMLFNIAVTLCFLIMMLYILRAHIGANAFAGIETLKKSVYRRVC